MRKTTSAILILTVAMLFAVPAIACDGKSSGKTEASVQKTSSDSKTAGCGPAEEAACKASGKVCPGMKKTTTSTSASLPNGHPVETVAQAQKCAGSTTAYLSVSNMTCGSCVSHVTKALGNVDGICAIDVNLEKGAATVVYHADKVSTDQMTTVVTKAGYTTTLTSIDQVDKANLKQLCAHICGDECTGKCKEHCANVCTGSAKGSKTAETSEI